jgi:hypothetical protein
MNAIHIRGLAPPLNALKGKPTMKPDLSTDSQNNPEDSDQLLGKVVKILERGKVLRVGRVECTTPSGDLLWIEALGLEPRALYGPALGHHIIRVH